MLRKTNSILKTALIPLLVIGVFLSGCNSPADGNIATDIPEISTGSTGSGSTDATSQSTPPPETIANTEPPTDATIGTTPPVDVTTPPTDTTTPPIDSTNPPAEPPEDTPPADPAPMPATKAEIIEFYKASANSVKNDAAADYTKRVWQEVDVVNLGSNFVNTTAKGVAKLFMKSESDAKEQSFERGTEKAIEKFPGWTLTDLSKVKSATCTQKENGNYQITIIMEDEDTPVKGDSFLEQVTNTILFWGEIEEIITTDSGVTSVLDSYENIHIIFRNFTIEAELTPEGQFITLDHTADVDITIGKARILKIYTINNGDGHMWNFSKFYDFLYE